MNMGAYLHSVRTFLSFLINLFNDTGANIDLPQFYYRSVVLDQNNGVHNDLSGRFRSGFVLLTQRLWFRSARARSHSDSDPTGHLNAIRDGNDLAVLTGFPGPRVGSAELNGAQNQGQDQAHRGHLARVRVRCRSSAELCWSSRTQGRNSTVFLKKPLRFRSDSQWPRARGWRTGRQPIRVREMERDSSKNQPLGYRKSDWGRSATFYE